MRILCALLLSLGAIAAGSVKASDALDFSGVIVAVNGPIAEVDSGAAKTTLYVRAPNTLSKTSVGQTVSGTCVMLGDLCTATVFTIAE